MSHDSFKEKTEGKNKTALSLLQRIWDQTEVYNCLDIGCVYVINNNDLFRSKSDLDFTRILTWLIWLSPNTKQMLLIASFFKTVTCDWQCWIGGNYKSIIEIEMVSQEVIAYKLKGAIKKMIEFKCELLEVIDNWPSLCWMFLFCSKIKIIQK